MTRAKLSNLPTNADTAAADGRGSSVVPRLDVRNLSKVFKSQGKSLVALKDIDLQVFPREFVTLVGPSGCGKSTLLSVIAGLEAPTSGEVRVDGEVVLGPGRDRGLIFQSYTLYPWLSVAENIAFGLNLRDIPKSEKKQRVGYYLEQIGLTKFANAYPSQLSGGMKQRVAIARALVNEPEILLMDEPFGALDAQTKEQMQLFILKLWEDTHTTILSITHDIEEAVFLGERTYVMGVNPGRIRSHLRVPFAKDGDLDIKLTPEFIEVKRQLLHELREGQN